MTTKEFKMCCVVFCKFFEGRKYGEIFPECYKNDNELIIDVVNLTFDDFTENSDARLENELIMWYKFRTKEIKIFSDSDNDIVKFKLVKDFLEFFNIPLEDII